MLFRDVEGVLSSRVHLRHAIRALAPALVCIATAAAADPPRATPAATPSATAASPATASPATTASPAVTPPVTTASAPAAPPAPAAVAPADATAPDPFEACKARRRALTADAMKVADPDARARLLLAMPTCRRFEDGRTEIVAERPPELPDTRPFAPRIGASVFAGFGANTVISNNELAPSGVGPLVEVDVSYRPNRRNSVALYATLARFGADNVVRTYGDGPIITSLVVPHVTDTLFGAGVRGRRHTGRWAIALGVGAVVEQYNDAQDMDTTNVLRSIDAQLTCELASTRHVAADLAVDVGDAGHFTSTERELLTARLLLGLHF
jgi:hypothetical protein